MPENPSDHRQATRRERRPFRPGEMPKLFGDTAATLIVDDDVQLADVLRRLLAREGYECTIARDAAEARARLAEREFALALVDVMMPDETGLELVADMLANHRNLAVVMVTGVDDLNIANLAIQSGVYGYVVKPFRPSQVLITVANASERRCIEIERDVYERRLELHLREQAADLDDALLKLKAAERRAGDNPTVELARSVAHDLNNSLGAILNYAFFINEELSSSAQGQRPPDRTALQQDAARIMRATEQAAEIVKRLQAVQAVEAVQAVDAVQAPGQEPPAAG
jgi:FixJ family two-component response regulator